MIARKTTPDLPEESNGERLWTRALRTVLALPYAKVDRTSFLRAQLAPHCTAQQVIKAIEGRPSQAGISPELIDKLADSCIRSHVLKASGTSFAAGLPGGIAMAATIPADLIQLQWNALMMAQKLAYLYGWPDLLENGNVDEQTELELTLLFGAMTGVAAAERGLAEIARLFAGQVFRRLPRQALTKTVYYPIAKQVAKWIGISLTKRGFAGGLAKAIPVIGGVVSAGVTAGTMQPMGKRLKNHLRELRYAHPDQEEQTEGLIVEHQLT